MCGIVALIGSREAAPQLLEGLRQLEYRGYDSASSPAAVAPERSHYRPHPVLTTGTAGIPGRRRSLLRRSGPARLPGPGRPGGLAGHQYLSHQALSPNAPMGSAAKFSWGYNSVIKGASEHDDACQRQFT